MRNQVWREKWEVESAAYRLNGVGGGDYLYVLWPFVIKSVLIVIDYDQINSNLIIKIDLITNNHNEY